MRRLAFYGGTFDPPHIGHLAIAEALLTEFSLDEFTFIPAFHAPHKLRSKSTSAYDRYAMLCLMSEELKNVSVSKIEIELPEKPYTVETLVRLKALFPDDRIYFVMGADSWMDILTWREWERVLLMTDHIVVTRPGVEISTHHVSEMILERVIDTREAATHDLAPGPHIYITDAVKIDVSASGIRQKIRNADPSWITQVPPAVANYVQKYQIY